MPTAADSGAERAVLGQHARRAKRGLLVLPSVAAGRAARRVQGVPVIAAQQPEDDRARVGPRPARGQHQGRRAVQLVEGHIHGGRRVHIAAAQDIQFQRQERAHRLLVVRTDACIRNDTPPPSFCSTE